MSFGSSAYFHQLRDTTGFLPKSSLPMVKSASQEAIPLYRFIEAWDAATDFDDLAERIPMLTIGQIGGAIGYVRRLAQFNVADLDIDRLEDEALEASAEFKSAIRNSFQDQSSFVLDLGNANG